jgi:hypothetical protein
MKSKIPEIHLHEYVRMFAGKNTRNPKQKKMIPVMLSGTFSQGSQKMPGAMPRMKGRMSRTSGNCRQEFIDTHG